MRCTDSRYRFRDKTRQDKTEARECFQSRTIDCETREQVKREEKKILQHQTTSVYTHFVRYLRTISHAPMYRPNNLLMILHTGKLCLSVQSHHFLQCRNTSSYVLIVLSSSQTTLTPPTRTSLNERLPFPTILHSSLCT
jgi:hypothetical protein